MHSLTALSPKLMNNRPSSKNVSQERRYKSVSTQACNRHIVASTDHPAVFHLRGWDPPFSRLQPLQQARRCVSCSRGRSQSVVSCRALFMDYGHCNTHRTDCSLSFAQTWEVDTRLFFSAKVRSCASTQTLGNSRCGKSITECLFSRPGGQNIDLVAIH